ncbi:26S protease regulatory subunit 6B like [Actinidia chinensis var. chinensis]|uniref:26S protease regulatory subunit 6B like n=1 Tax=Actinidia chinensis var. chinensis TaxID=1590841 RepID=A0A2R6QZA0_ACTCC|nr:26S protease regulatory subunit 6B like [Actinidia chinensis var. chinensis]
MELLTQMDGFGQTVNVNVIMTTNRADTLDPALLRPGRLDRKIEFPLLDRRQKRPVFQVCTAKMNLGDEVDLEDYVSHPDKISAAEIATICQEAGIHAARKMLYFRRTLRRVIGPMLRSQILISTSTSYDEC